MANQEDLTAFANKFGLYIDIRPCDKCLNPEIDSEHGYDCDEYKAIYEWVENRVREQIAKEIEDDESPITGDFKIVNLQNVLDGVGWATARYANLVRGSE